MWVFAEKMHVNYEQPKHSANNQTNHKEVFSAEPYTCLERVLPRTASNHFSLATCGQGVSDPCPGLGD